MEMRSTLSIEMARRSRWILSRRCTTIDSARAQSTMTSWMMLKQSIHMRTVTLPRPRSPSCMLAMRMRNAMKRMLQRSPVSSGCRSTAVHSEPPTTKRVVAIVLTSTTTYERAITSSKSHMWNCFSPSITGWNMRRVSAALFAVSHSPVNGSSFCSITLFSSSGSICCSAVRLEHV